MIDTDKYEGLNELIDRIINSDEIGVDDLLADSMAVKDGINELLAEVKRLREDNELYLACINTSQYKHEPGSAFRELGTVRQWQGRQREHVGALRCVYGKHPRDYLKEAEE